MDFTAVEMHLYFSYFTSKHRLWVHVRNPSLRATQYVLEQK